MKKQSINLILAALLLVGIGSAGCGSSSPEQSLAYGGLAMAVSASSNVAAAPFSPMSEPLMMDDGITITAAGIVMENIRFILAPGQELRWRERNGEHWNSEYMGYEKNGNGDMNAAELENGSGENYAYEYSLSASGTVDPVNGTGETPGPEGDGVDAGEKNQNGSIGESEPVRGEDCGENAEIEAELAAAGTEPQLPGPYYINLLAGQPYPEFATTVIPAGTYNTILFRLGEVTSENAVSLGLDAASPLVSNSLIIEGTFTSGTDVVSFRVLFADDDESTYRLELFEGLEVTPDTFNTVVMEFNVGQWITNIDLLNLYQEGACESALTCMVDGDGVYNFTITEQELRNTLRERFRNSVACGKDADGNGKLGAGERKSIQAVMENGQES